MVSRQIALPITYEGETLDVGYRLDLLVNDLVIIEVKAVEALTRLHEAQMLTYLRLSGRRLGYLMNFNVPMFRTGVRRLVLCPLVLLVLLVSLVSLVSKDLGLRRTYFAA